MTEKRDYYRQPTQAFFEKGLPVGGPDVLYFPPLKGDESLPLAALSAQKIDFDKLLDGSEEVKSRELRGIFQDMQAGTRVILTGNESAVETAVKGLQKLLVEYGTSHIIADLRESNGSTDERLRTAIAAAEGWDRSPLIAYIPDNHTVPPTNIPTLQVGGKVSNSPGASIYLW